jgi:hypothetical protein
MQEKAPEKEDIRRLEGSRGLLIPHPAGGWGINRLLLFPQ